jgi:hypothetical protein
VRRVFCLLLFCLAGAAFANGGREIETASNHQRIFPIDSEVYPALTALYLSQGLALPSTTGPWSEGELLLLLDRLSAPGEGEAEVFRFVEETLSRHDKPFKLQGQFNVEGRGHTETERVSTPDMFIRPPVKAKPLFELLSEAYLTDHFYGFGVLSIGNSLYNLPVTTADGRGPYAGSVFFGSAPFGSNIFPLPPGSTETLNANFPVRAFVSAGGTGWNVQVGRERLSWGPGESGNFVVGDHIPYHNSARLSAYNGGFKFTFNISSFAHPDDYFTKRDANGNPVAGWAPAVAYPDRNLFSFKALRLFLAHRLEWRALGGRLNLALTEGLIYQNSDGALDPTLLNPLYLMHNLYRWENGNSILAFEADWTFLPRVNGYFQFVMDEFAFPGLEPLPGKAAKAQPDALGFMLGAKTAFPAAGGLVTASVEGVYTTPYLYLRGTDPLKVDDKETPGVNWIVANRYHYDSFRYFYPEEYLGYRWGGDAIVLNLRGGYRRLGRWSLTGNLLLMAHGAFDKWTLYDPVATPENYQTTPTTEHPTPNYADPNPEKRNAVSWTAAFSVEGSWQITSHLSLYGQTDFLWVRNPGNIRENPPLADLQFVIGVSYAL